MSLKKTLAYVGAAAIVGSALTAQFVGAADTDPVTHYSVEGADSWNSIASAHGVTADALQVANNVAASTSDSAHPRTGWIIHIPKASPATTTTAPATTTTVAPTSTLPPTTSTTSPSTSTTVRPTTTTAAPTTTAAASSDFCGQSAQAGAQFCEGFTNPDSVGRFQVQTSFGGDSQHPTVSPSGHDIDMLGDHDMSCGAPTTSRTINMAHPDSLVWYCAPGGDPAKGHLMTATACVGYCQVAFSPKQAFTNVRQICWDQNMTDTGGRKWTQVAIVPEADFQRNGGGLNYAANDLMPAPATGFMTIGGGGMLIRFQNGGTSLITEPAGSPSGAVPASPNPMQPAPIFHDVVPYQNGMATSDKATRFTQCVEDTGTGTRMTVKSAIGTSTGIANVRIPQGDVRVIFQDDTYDNYKGDLGNKTGGVHDPDSGSGAPDDVGDTDPRITWHWDNIEIN